jgi:hypothetical protein
MDLKVKKSSGWLGCILISRSLQIYLHFDNNRAPVETFPRGVMQQPPRTTSLFSSFFLRFPENDGSPKRILEIFSEPHSGHFPGFLIDLYFMASKISFTSDIVISNCSMIIRLSYG